MKLIISKEVAEWYKEELHLTNGDALRFFVRYGGVGGNVPGFSLGVNVDNPTNPHHKVTISHIQFFVEENDAWYFDQHNLQIDLDKRLNEPVFSYV